MNERAREKRLVRNHHREHDVQKASEVDDR